MKREQIVFQNHEHALQVAKILLEEDYVVMLSYEDEYLVVNYIWTEHHADRNEVVFMHHEDYEEELDELSDAIIANFKEDYDIID